MSQLITYEAARSEKELRAPYLDQLKAMCGPSVSDLFYDPDAERLFAYTDELAEKGYLEKEKLEASRKKFKSPYFLVLFSPSLLGTKIAHPIFTFDSAFEKLIEEKYFLNSLLDHEGEHTDQLMHGFRLPNGLVLDYSNVAQVSDPLVIGLREILANKKQIANLEQRGITDTYFRAWIEWNLDSAKHLFFSKPATSDLEKQLHSTIF